MRGLAIVVAAACAAIAAADANAFVPDGEFASFSGDASRVAASNATGAAGVFETATGRRLFRFPQDAFVLNAIFSPDGSRVATTGGQAAVWSAKTGRRLFSIARPRGTSVWDAAFNADGTRLAASYSDGAARIWNVSAGRVRHALIGGHTGDVNAIAYDPSTTLLATTGEGDASIRVWDARTGTTIHVIWGWNTPLNDLVFSPDGTLVAGATTGGLVVIRKASPPGVPAPPHSPLLELHTTNAFDVNFSPDGRDIIAAGENGAVRIWRVADGRLLRTLPVGRARILVARFSPDGRWIATGAVGGRVSLFDAASGRRLHRLADRGGVASLAFSSDGRMLLAAGDHARLWSVPGGRLVRVFR